MKNKNIIVGLFCFIGGFSGGYIFAINKLKADYQASAAENKEFYMARLDEMGVMKDDFTPNHLEDAANEDEDEEYEEIITGEQYSSVVSEALQGKGRLITNYNKPPLVFKERPTELEPLEDEEDENDEEMTDEEYEAELEARAEEQAERRYENKRNGLPYVINHQEFLDGPDEYTKYILYYYSEDRMLCEDDDSIVDDEELIVGLDYEDVLDMQTNVWVRNDSTLSLYEIHRIDDSYNNSVANVVETPREREYRLSGRRKQIMDK